jgi:hypothetical protein
MRNANNMKVAIEMKAATALHIKKMRNLLKFSQDTPHPVLTR